MTPAYSATLLSWVESGGVYVVASLRGGGEEGEQWHRAGMLGHKQNVFDDFHACAEHLLATGWATPELLACSGGSNGGLLVGAAITQRPDLFRAAVCSAPLLDMVRYEHFGLGTTWNEEYGTAADPEQLAWLVAYSPYHHVRDGVPLPGHAVHRLRRRHAGRPAARAQAVRRTPACRPRGGSRAVPRGARRRPRCTGPEPHRGPVR